ncbi:MAG TPA: hypothetical protein VFR75_10760 [Solirubrobacterales bacterium]|nr:hypothetical protein [Solirubrobacterales bacterium]
MAERERIVMLSGGAGSWGAARRIADRYGTEQLTLLFADTLIEDDDLYRFLLEATANLLGASVPADLLRATASIPPLGDEEGRRRHLLELAAAARSWCPSLEWIAEGRDPHQVFRDKRFLGNTRVDPCSAVLKRRLMRRWLEEHRDPAGSVAAIGYDWSEIHRFERAAGHWAPWPVEAPLCERPYLSKEEVFGWMEVEGLRPPRLYAEGFRHNNCGGFCVKGGQASFALLLRRYPERYRYHERREQELREALGKDVAILRDRTGGETKPLSLRRFRRRLECDPAAFDRGQWGACSCMESTATARGGA